MLYRELVDTTRGRIVGRLRAGEATVDEIASALGLTANAVRSQLVLMERDGLVRRGGRQAGVTRPSQLFEITPEVEQLLSRAYVPLLSQLVRVVTERLSKAEVESLMRRTGKALADKLSPPLRASASLAARVQAASDFLNEQLGAVTRVQKNGSYTIRGTNCPVAALTGKHAAVCVAVESLVEAIVGAPVKECCEREGRPRCCFQIASAGGRPYRTAKRSSTRSRA